MTKRFVFDLSDERRDALEAYRARNGLRSLAGALHHLIDNAALIEAARRLDGPTEVQDRIAEARESIARGARQAGKRFSLSTEPAEPVSTPKAARQSGKASKAVSETPSRIVGPKLDIPVGPLPFTPRLRGLQKGKAK
jgi:hypothetical protein